MIEAPKDWAHLSAVGLGVRSVVTAVHVKDLHLSVCNALSSATLL